MIHSAVHEARDDVQCVLHTHTRAGVAVSAQKCGVLPISQQSTFVLASLAYHEYEGVAFRDEEKPRLQADMGQANFLMLRNHGLLVAGKSIADAFLSMYIFESACQIQLSAQAGGDYAIGSNHVLPTSGAARVRGGLSGADFVRQITVQRVTRAGLSRIGPAVVALARAEGLEAHARSIEIRRG